jgi:phosphoribosylaminoimidazole-succinocarboxamide synthase
MTGFTQQPVPVQVPGLTHLRSGKVRELYRNPVGDLVMVASDRTSVFDWVLPSEIPDKGRILTQLSLWWFDQLADVVPNHVISTDVPEGAPADWAGRILVCRPLAMAPVECVVRGYLAGSGLVEYLRDGTVAGIALPPGLTEGSELTAPIFTPASKAEVGEHDENLTYEQAQDRVGAQTADVLRETSLAVYRHARDLAADQGIVLADTKLEFGFEDGRLMLADEVLTPDCSRLWPMDAWKPGRSQPSFDKQFVRDWLTSPESGWDRHGELPPPLLPEDIVEQTRAKYVEAYQRLTGECWS